MIREEEMDLKQAVLALMAKQKETEDAYQRLRENQRALEAQLVKTRTEKELLEEELRAKRRKRATIDDFGEEEEEVQSELRADDRRTWREEEDPRQAKRVTRVQEQVAESTS